ncbi:histone-fold-containing protein [Suillus subluteus]|nr:histone-fold-containing protein [Suillus subluteus]KAG1880739.1 histone-fold-containing protein [Suillus subluteus]
MKTKNKQTKFPVARIKKIMQKDEEVGKVAQATPVVISKALELFLAMIVDEATKVTVERGAKKVEAYHLKHAIETTEMLDFLKEIVESVPDPSAGGTIDLQAEAAENAKRKRSKAKKNGAAPGEAPKRRRKKKEEEADMEGVPEETMGEVKSEEGDPRMEDDDDAYEESSSRPRQRRNDDDEDDMPYVPR